MWPWLAARRAKRARRSRSGDRHRGPAPDPRCVPARARPWRGHRRMHHLRVDLAYLGAVLGVRPRRGSTHCPVPASSASNLGLSPWRTYPMMIVSVERFGATVKYGEPTVIIGFVALSPLSDTLENDMGLLSITRRTGRDAVTAVTGAAAAVTGGAYGAAGGAVTGAARGVSQALGTAPAPPRRPRWLSPPSAPPDSLTGPCCLLAAPVPSSCGNYATHQLPTPKRPAQTGLPRRNVRPSPPAHSRAVPAHRHQSTPAKPPPNPVKPPPHGRHPRYRRHPQHGPLHHLKPVAPQPRRRPGWKAPAAERVSRALRHPSRSHHPSARDNPRCPPRQHTARHSATLKAVIG